MWKSAVGYPTHSACSLPPPRPVCAWRYGDFFPGTGALGDVGQGKGKLYSVNVPLQEGIDDESYKSVFEPVMQKASCF